MRAVRLRGGVPQVVEVAAPAPPSGGQLLVRVVASSLNGTDLGLLRGDLPAGGAGLVAPGFDLAGEVVACGPSAASAASPCSSPVALAATGQQAAA